MDYREALEYLRGDVTQNCFGCNGKDKLGCDEECLSLRALRLVTECVEKRMPATVSYFHEDKHWEYETCPHCGQEVYEDEHRYCPWCGQKLEWREE